MSIRFYKDYLTFGNMNYKCIILNGQFILRRQSIWCRVSLLKIKIILSYYYPVVISVGKVIIFSNIGGIDTFILKQFNQIGFTHTQTEFFFKRVTFGFAEYNIAVAGAVVDKIKFGNFRITLNGEFDIS